MAGSILLVDDDVALLETLSRYFEGSSFEVLRAANARHGAQLFESHLPDVVLLDLDLPDVSGLDLLEVLCAKGATVVMLTGEGDIPTAVKAMRVGAENFLTKPVEFEHLSAVVERAMEKARLKRTQRHQRTIAEQDPLEGLGLSTRMSELATQIQRLAEAGRTSVLLLGESGTGKGWVAERIHLLSPRAQGPFIEINCATLTGTFLESELFGHEKGAFTDAKTMKRGLFEVADAGTLFLDEVGELDTNLQPKLLKVLESQTFRRIGGTREISVDVRLIAASNRDLQAATQSGEFRRDLYYRLNVAPIEVPPLRDRSREDVAALAGSLFRELCLEFPRGPQRMSTAALDVLVKYDWPGNVRELRNVLERARIFAGDVEALEVEHLPADVRGMSKGLGRGRSGLQTLDDVEREHLELALVHCQGNRSEAARALGISRTTLHAKIKKYGLERVALEAD